MHDEFSGVYERLTDYLSTYQERTTVLEESERHSGAYLLLVALGHAIGFMFHTRNRSCEQMKTLAFYQALNRSCEQMKASAFRLVLPS